MESRTNKIFFITLIVIFAYIDCTSLKSKVAVALKSDAQELIVNGVPTNTKGFSSTFDPWTSTNNSFFTDVQSGFPMFCITSIAKLWDIKQTFVANGQGKCTLFFNIVIIQNWGSAPLTFDAIVNDKSVYHREFGSISNTYINEPLSFEFDFTSASTNYLRFAYTDTQSGDNGQVCYNNVSLKCNLSPIVPVDEC